MNSSSRILHFVDTYSHLWSENLHKQLQNSDIVDVISMIMQIEDKTASEAVLLFLSAIRYNENGSTNLDKLASSQSLDEYCRVNQKDILDTVRGRTVQANFPGRAFPVLEVLGRVGLEKDVFIIELGASFGLIGRALLAYNEIYSMRELFFTDEQQYPDFTASVESYFGIELSPPDKKWLLSCIASDYEREKLDTFISKINPHENHSVVKGSAFHLDEIMAAQGFDLSKYTVVILTSYMLYQFSTEQQEELLEEIYSFIKPLGGHWINQCVDVRHDTKVHEFFIEFDGKKIIKLSDDKATTWQWLANNK